MRRVYASAYIAECDQLRASLSLAGIESMMKNEFGNSVGLAIFGGVAAFAEPEVWVDEPDYKGAMKIVEDFGKVASDSDTSKSRACLCEWQCPNCGEAIEGTMNACWKCETVRPQQQVEVSKHESSNNGSGMDCRKERLI